MSGLKIQKFFNGDLVQIGNIPFYMGHFENNCQAIVIGTYCELCDYDNENSLKKYAVYVLPEGNYEAWYDEAQLAFIAPDQFLLLPIDHYARKVFEAKRKRDQRL